MPLTETLPLTAATDQWEIWSTTARIVVTEAQKLPAARVIADAQLAAVEQACSRFRSDSELMNVPTGAQAPVSALLAHLVRAALAAAELTDGAVTPTLGNALSALGYDRDWSLVEGRSLGPTRMRLHRAPRWQDVVLNGNVLTVPCGLRLDLGATAKAFTADLIAAAVARQLSTGVMVALGGDIATAGAIPAERWNVLVQDRPGDPSVTVALPPGGAIATSSTQSRRWAAGEQRLHHILDPRNCRPAQGVWRTATVAAASCLWANAFSTAALVLGADAPAWLRRHNAPSRLVAATGEVITTAGFPAGDER